MNMWDGTKKKKERERLRQGEKGIKVVGWNLGGKVQRLLHHWMDSKRNLREKKEEKQLMKRRN